MKKMLESFQRLKVSVKNVLQTSRWFHEAVKGLRKFQNEGLLLASQSLAHGDLVLLLLAANQHSQLRPWFPHYSQYLYGHFNGFSRF